ncbi:MAG: methylated-DNA--[protein]-cysteine S-methyltransferase [Candidatus Cloacimonadaceae bacterium]|jgi:methylated-DNA-[protein]-cysteine S-methyltransferase|nr:methylated-DNA--[protein]-cysteine S-methyltransferase [Candidatus Cloacimonadota bacterium]MDX9949071.1 methylated-DNA--[protein]-cysteine S-methyltransferase [Candidatus Syntrophosphaera sp.]
MASQKIYGFSFEGMELGIVVEDGKVREVEFGKYPDNGGGEEVEEVRRQLREYLSGKRKEFDLKLEPQGTQFQKDVWNAMLEIPYGETRSYKEIAQRIGRPLACRAVGQASNRNPIAIIIPCHRVVGSNGSLTGYGGGMPIKIRLLDLEKKAEKK